ncbi:MAG: T9SS type A sorting domain-containing protein [Candidatus Krumholzibacteria bacterium]|nr:T9SS type A sorting domain-containing protein [Candidatus Krumholzibacteria bacterium]MDH4338043.1 T9SS type A sorting domain-containing protein [Candidatus Krumholzibacteria bacterium]MDH5269394.1 T9SS type A sorting domain-containing protein [Candidatus Krumholzibacteria bacterium]
MARAAWFLPAILCAGILAASSAPAREGLRSPEPTPVEEFSRPASRMLDSGALFSSAAATTTVLYSVSFDIGASCNDMGWTSVDNTAQPGVFFHVDDYAGLNPAEMFPLRGAKSMWCGARPQTVGPLCNYRTLPGYGNGWDQSFATKNCIPVSGDGILNVNLIIRAESEPGYDFTFTEYTLDCTGADGWTQLSTTTYYDPVPIDGDFDIGTTGPIKFRFHFTSDGAWSDEDGLWPTNGAVHIDSLAVEGLALEDFEDEDVGASETQDWVAYGKPGYGTTASLVLGASTLQEDPCVTDLSCMWAFFVGSTERYNCGLTHPEQLAVPKGNSRGQFINNFIISPDIPLIGSGNEINLEFDVYRDMPLDNLVFYNWEVRNVTTGCPENWQNRTSVYYGAQKDWLRMIQPVGDLLNQATATHFTVGLWVWDGCEFWCGQVGTGACHNHAPLFDNVKVYRVAHEGPAWSVLDRYQFQDNFATDGTLTGTVRADIAYDLLPNSNPGILPGDSSVVRVEDRTAGLATDPTYGGAAVYAYVSVWPQGQTGKSGAGLTDNPVRWPVVGAWTDAAGVEWTCLRLDSLRWRGNVGPDYCLDLNDDLFTPGDTICFFYAAKNTNGIETCAFGSDLMLQTDDREEAASNPGEFTCLPAGGYNRGGDILYVDGMDGRGAQPAFDLAFAALGIDGKVDRYDVRAPSSKLGNRPAGRVANVSTQLVGPYRKILWDTGNVSVTLGDGGGNPEKTDDYGLLNAFLDGLAEDGGVYLCGDDLADALNGYAGASAIAFRTTNMPFVLTSNDHRPSFGISPTGTSTGLCFTSDPTFTVQGGCPLLNDFDVLEPSGSSAMEIAYGAPAGTNGGVLSNARVNGNTATVGVLMSGFGFEYVADDDLNGVSDRADHLHDIITWLGNTVGGATGAGPSYQTTLSQNYPNPFNPQTTIGFSVKASGRVRLAIYDVSGALVRELVNGDRDRGSYTETWDGRDARGAAVATGVYFYRLETSDRALSRKMVLLK